MNSRDTIDCLIRGKKADRIGLYESYWPEITEKWKNQMGDNPTTHFGLDMVFVGGWFDIRIRKQRVNQK